MTDLELTNKRQSLINQMMDIAASVSAADDLEVMDSKHAEIKDLKLELDKLPTLSDLGKCEYCGLEGVEVMSYDLQDGDFAIGCVDEDTCRRQMMYNEWGADV